MQPHATLTALLLTALAAGGCLRAHDGRVKAAPGEEAPRPAAAEETGEPSSDARAPAQAAAAALPAAQASGSPGEVDFAGQVQPILAARCQPCHFTGGKMYEQLPFDDPATVRHLGERLFTRIRAPEEQAVIRAFLAQEASGGGAAAERRQ